jgi:hypothetical protein
MEGGDAPMAEIDALRARYAQLSEEHEHLGYKAAEFKRDALWFEGQLSEEAGRNREQRKRVEELELQVEDLRLMCKGLRHSLAVAESEKIQDAIDTVAARRKSAPTCIGRSGKVVSIWPTVDGIGQLDHPSHISDEAIESTCEAESTVYHLGPEGRFRLEAYLERVEDRAPCPLPRGTCRRSKSA